MDQRIVSSAWKLQAALRDIGNLNLWAARAILGETRDFTCTVLHWLASDGSIRYRPMDGQVFIALSDPVREASGGLRK
jgi:hypothetical protein